ncbi:hypothetical protein FFLO_05179 [Filobasidium floriforme]|uniref:Bicarbonate transporter-like transmembrane domain-containing protein n=1 Tax=Filobasidium floriforme TaxID=5210 RepID=A0A8K0JHH7_9TREE|nr:hypothetical protein FFLO_05179 [Filobasidium floriforme]
MTRRRTGSSVQHTREIQPAQTEGAERTPRKWYLLIGRGMYRDVRNRLPYYRNDWTDAWNYRVVPATFMIFFANVLPGIAFALDLIESTGQTGVQEVLLATFIAAGAAAFLGAQPLLISGVTGPITVFNKTIHTIFVKNGSGGPDFNYLHFLGWVYLWGAILHWVTALFNAVSLLKYVTRFPCDTFGFYVAMVYLQYGIQVVTRQFGQTDDASAFLGILLAILTLVIPHLFDLVYHSPFLHRQLRRFCADYGMPITVIACSGLAYWGTFHGYVTEEAMTLPTTGAYTPAGGRDWVVKFWQLPGKYVGIAFPFGLVLWILFIFEYVVPSLIAQGSEFPLRKPAGFHWDFFLLGITTLLAGIFGVPAPNGLIPQAPLHTASLVVMGIKHEHEDEESTLTDRQDHEAGNRRGSPSSQERNGSGPLKRRVSEVKREIEKLENQINEKEVAVAVVEQRVSNLVQGAFCLVLMTGPFEKLLGFIPKGVLAGLFWYMGSSALFGSGVTALFLFLIKDRRLTSPSDPLRRVRKSRIMMWLVFQLLGFAATFAITNTIAAIGFPIVIALLIPFRILVIPRLHLFTEDELNILDGPVASPFTMQSVNVA